MHIGSMTSIVEISHRIDTKNLRRFLRYETYLAIFSSKIFQMQNDCASVHIADEQLML